MYILQVLLCLGLIFGTSTAPHESGEEAKQETVQLSEQKLDPNQNPFAKRVLKLTRALRAIVTLDPEVEEEMRSAAAARALLATQTVPVERLGDQKPRHTWFGFMPQLSASGSSWFPISTRFQQEKNDASSVLLPISPVREQRPSPYSKDVFRSAEMPNPDATGWLGVPEESVGNRRTEAPSDTERWIKFHDAGGTDMTFGDYGMENLDTGRQNVVLQNTELTKHGKPILKLKKEKVSTKTKFPKDYSKAQEQSDAHNEIHLGDLFFHKNVLPAPVRYQPV